MSTPRESGLHGVRLPAIDCCGPATDSLSAPSPSSRRSMPQKFSPSADRRGFTIIETAVVLVIIALMIVVIVPHFVQEWNLDKAQRVKADLVSLNGAIEHYALDNGKTAGITVSYDDLRKYLDPETDIYKKGGRNAFGDTYAPFVIGARPAVPQHSADKLASVTSPDYWSPFQFNPKTQDTGGSE